MSVPTYTRDHLPAAVETFGTYRKVSTTAALRINGPFRCVTSEGDAVTCDDGWLAIDAHGYPYPINADEFAVIYEPDDGDQTPTLLHLLASLYDSADVDCLGGDYSCDYDDPADRCIVCKVGDYLAKVAKGGAADDD